MSTTLFAARLPQTPGYTSYSSFLNQAGTAAPVATNENNEFSPTTATWARTSAGLYTLTFSTAVLTANKTAVTISTPIVALVGFIAVVTSTTVITLTSGVLTAGAIVATDVLLTNTKILVEVSN